VLARNLERGASTTTVILTPRADPELRARAPSCCRCGVIPLITLAGVLVLTLLVIRGPLRRATRIQPGTALRYQ
jgi:hypothetical protein